jgi:hypothetical protein
MSDRLTNPEATDPDVIYAVLERNLRRIEELTANMKAEARDTYTTEPEKAIAALDLLLAERDAAVKERDEAREALADSGVDPVDYILSRPSWEERHEAAKCLYAAAVLADGYGKKETAQRFREASAALKVDVRAEAAEATLTRYRNALEAICQTNDSGPWIEVYRQVGGGYEGLQAIARAALDGPKEEQ